jgi:hypothetical protein
LLSLILIGSRSEGMGLGAMRSDGVSVKCPCQEVDGCSDQPVSGTN